MWGGEYKYCVKNNICARRPGRYAGGAGKAERRRLSVCGNAFSLRGFAAGKEVSVIPVKNKRKNSSA